MTILKRYTRLLESLALMSLGAALTIPSVPAALWLLMLSALLDIIYCKLSPRP